MKKSFMISNQILAVLTWKKTHNSWTKSGKYTHSDLLVCKFSSFLLHSKTIVCTLFYSAHWVKEKMFLQVHIQFTWSTMVQKWWKVVRIQGVLALIYCLHWHPGYFEFSPKCQTTQWGTCKNKRIDQWKKSTDD